MYDNGGYENGQIFHKKYFFSRKAYEYTKKEGDLECEKQKLYVQ